MTVSISAVREVVRFSLALPSLRRLETLAADRSQLRRLACLSRVLLRPRMRKATSRLRRVLPDSLVYRSFCVPAALWSVMRDSARAVAVSRGPETPLSRTLSDYATVLGQCLRYPGMLPEEFYLYGAARPENEAHLPWMAHNDEVILVMLLAGRQSDDQGRRWYKSLDDKLEFHALCRRAGVPVAPLIATFSKGEVHWTDAHRLPRRDLFVKPVFGFQGMGAARVFFSEAQESYFLETPDKLPSVIGIQVDYPEKPLPADALVAHLAEASRPMSMMLQPRLATHPDLARLVGTRTLSSLRVITVKGRSGKPTVLSAFLRSAVTDSPVDNVSSGGIGAETDRTTGRLTGKASIRTGTRKIQEGHTGYEWVTRHPTTGTPIKDFPVPHFSEAVRLSETVHQAAAEAEDFILPLVGWDVGITEDGPILLEGNVGANLEYQGFGPNPFWREAAFHDSVLSYVEELEASRLSLLDLGRPLTNLLRDNTMLFRSRHSNGAEALPGSGAVSSSSTSTPTSS